MTSQDVAPMATAVAMVLLGYVLYRLIRSTTFGRRWKRYPAPDGRESWIMIGFALAVLVVTTGITMLISIGVLHAASDGATALTLGAPFAVSAIATSIVWRVRAGRRDPDSGT